MDSSPTQTSSRRSSRERLLMTEMDSLEEPREKNVRLDGKQYITQSTHRYLDQPNNSEDVVEARSSPSQSFQPNRLDHNDATSTSPTVPVYKVYKRRFLGLLQLTLLNIIVSWDWLTFAPVSTSSASYFAVSETAINWLSTAFLFAFVVATPAVIWILNRGGPKPAIVVASGLILAGNWIRYAGSRAREEGAGRGGYGMVMFGQILIGLAQPFVLSAPTRYSDLWFTEKGRISATAVASLANPLGGALGQLIDPLWVAGPSDVPNMVLYVAIISTIATLPSLFLPSGPPTPPTHASSLARPTLSPTTLLTLLHNPSFYLLALPFTTYVATFNAFTSLLNQLLYPYAYTETQAGITGALLILTGLLSSAILSPLLDRRPSWRLRTIKILVPTVAAMYLAFIFAPATRTVAAPYAIASVLGAASFGLVPLALELLVEVTYPVSPEVSSSLCWAGGQLFGAIFILVMDTIRGGGWRGEPEGSGKGALVFLAVVAWVVVPAPMCLGYFGTGRKGREEVEREVGGGIRSEVG